MLPGRNSLIPDGLLNLAATLEESWPQHRAALVESGVPTNIGTTVLGTRGTGTMHQSMRRIEMRDEVLELEPNVTPLTVLSTRIANVTTGNPEYKWLEGEMKPRFDAVDTTTGTGTAVRVDNAAKFSNGDTVKVTRTGEVMLVTAVNTGTNTLTVTRGIGAAAVALADNDELLIIGSAQPEGDGARVPRSINPVEVKNYTQIFRDPFASTETSRHSESQTRTSDWNRTAAETGKEHKKSMEEAYWYGRPSEALSGGANGQPLRTTGGALHYIATNVTDVGGAMTEAELWAALSPMYRFASKNKVGFGSMLALDVINGFPRGKLDLVQADRDRTYGLDVRTLVHAHGTLQLVTNLMFEGSKYGGYLAVLDMSMIRRRYLANRDVGSRDTHIRTNIQAPDVDARMDEYLSECGLEFGQERAHGLITGITS